MAYKEPSFDSKSIKAFINTFNDGVQPKKKSSTKKTTSKKTKK